MKVRIAGHAVRMDDGALMRALARQEEKPMSLPSIEELRAHRHQDGCVCLTHWWPELVNQHAALTAVAEAAKEVLVCHDDDEGENRTCNHFRGCLELLKRRLAALDEHSSVSQREGP